MRSAIRIANLGKRYRIAPGVHGFNRRTLRESLTEWLTRPLARSGGATAEQPDEFWSLKDVNLEVRSGEVIGVVGRNGAGKSTLLKILSRITAPTTGEVVIHGRVGSLLEVGTGFHPELTGRENVFLNGAILGMPRHEIARRFNEIVAFAEVERFIDMPVKRYSSGMYVRLGFAVAAHLNPDILLIDEVLSVGDHAFQIKSLGRMEEIRAGGATILFVSHNLQAVAQMCATTLVLSQGRVAFMGPTEEALKVYCGEVARRPGSARPVSSDSAIEEGLIRGGASITRLEIVNAAGKPVSVLTSGERAACEMEVYFEEEAVNPVPACFVKSPQGLMLYDINTTWMRRQTGRFHAGRSYVFQWPFTCHLLPGKYYLGADLAWGDLSGYYDRLEYGVPFDVVGNGAARGIVDLHAALRVSEASKAVNVS